MQRRLRSDRGISLVKLLVIFGLLLPSAGALAVAIAAIPRPSQNMPTASGSTASSVRGAPSVASSSGTALVVPAHIRSSDEAQAAAIGAARDRSTSAEQSNARVAGARIGAPNAQYLAVATSAAGNQSAPPPVPTSDQGLVLGAATSTTDPVTHAELDAALTQLRADLYAQVAAARSATPISFSGPAPTTPISTQAFAASQKIDNLTGVTISNATIDAASIPDLSAKYLSLNGGAVVGTTTFSGGNVGLGTTNPGKTLDIEQSTATLGLTSTTGTNAAYSTFQNTGGRLLVGMNNASGNLLLYSPAVPYAGTITTDSGSYPLVLGTQYIPRLIISPSGNVGVGTTSPGFKFSVADSGSTNPPTAWVEHHESGSYPYASLYMDHYTSGIGNQGGADVSFSNNGTLEAQLRFDVNLGIPDELSLINYTTDGPIVFGTNNATERMRITSSGNVGIGTANPNSFLLQVKGNVGPDASNSYNLGAAGSNWGCFYYNSGTLGTCASDVRLKTNIETLTFDMARSSALDQIAGLHIRAFAYKSATSTTYHGLVAQEVQQVAPELVAEDASTTLLSVKYGDIQWLVVEALQELIAKVNDLADTVTGFVEKFTTNELTFSRATGTELSLQQLNTGRLCATKSDGKSVCVTGDQLAALLTQAGGAGAAVTTDTARSPSSTDTASTTPAADAGAGQPPVIQINGQNPAIIHVGDTYNDLGATIVSPDADKNLGIKTFLNGRLVSAIAIDTTKVATDTIDYVVTDAVGLTSTSTRAVVIQPWLDPPTQSSTPTSTPATGATPLVSSVPAATGSPSSSPPVSTTTAAVTPAAS